MPEPLFTREEITSFLEACKAEHDKAPIAWHTQILINYTPKNDTCEFCGHVWFPRYKMPLTGATSTGRVGPNDDVRTD